MENPRNLVRGDPHRLSELRLGGLLGDEELLPDDLTRVVGRRWVGRPSAFSSVAMAITR